MIYNLIKEVFEQFNTQDEYLQSRFIGEGQENLIYKIVGHSRSYVVRISKEVRTKVDATYEYTFITDLRSHKIPVAKLYSTTDSEYSLSIEGNSYSLFEFIDGEHIEHLEKKHLIEVGGIMGRMHKIANELDYSFDRLLDTNHLEWLDDVQSVDGDGSAISKIMFNLYQMGTRLIKNNITSAPRVPLHNDIYQDNLLFRDDKLVGIIDFDESHNHYIPIELGWTIKELCNTDISGEFIPRIMVFINEYQKTSILTEMEIETVWATILAEFARGFLKNDNELDNDFSTTKVENIIDLSTQKFSVLL